MKNFILGLITGLALGYVATSEYSSCVMRECCELGTTIHTGDCHMKFWKGSESKNHS